MTKKKDPIRLPKYLVDIMNFISLVSTYYFSMANMFMILYKIF